MPDTVQLIDPSGQSHDIPLADAGTLLAQPGWHQRTSADTSRLAGDVARERDYGGTGGAAKAAAYAVLRGATVGASDLGFRALGANPEDLSGYQKQNPLLSTGFELGGALLPAVVAPETLLSKLPAGQISRVGRAVLESAEGAGALGRAGAAAAGAAVEGSLFSGGQYLSQVALEDKPLSAEGFVGAMGKGALWAAPIGGALSLGESTLLRAKSLFPRREVSKQAAHAVDQEATSAISQAVRDGDQMLEVARQRIAQVDAKAGAAASTERATRAMFGAAEPAAIESQVAHGVEKAKLTEAVDRYTQAKTQFDDWVRAEADPNLEAALLRVRAPDIQTGRPSLRVPEFDEVVPPQRALPEMGEFGIERTSVGKGLAKDAPPPPPAIEAPPSGLPTLPSPDKTTLFDISESGLRFDPQTRTYHPIATGTPSPSPLPSNSELLSGLRQLRGEIAPVPEGSIPEYGALKQHLDRVGRDYYEQTLSGDVLRDRGWYEPPGGLKDRVARAKALKEIAGENPPVVTLNVTPSGKIVVHDGQYLLDAAVEYGAPLRVKWTTGLEPVADEVLRSGSGQLEDLLKGTQQQINAGKSISEIGAQSPGYAEYLAQKATRTEEAATKAKARHGGDYASSDMARAEAEMQAAAATLRETGSPFEAAELKRLEQMIRDGKLRNEAGRGPFTDDGVHEAARRVLAKRGQAPTRVSAVTERAAQKDAQTIVDRSFRGAMGDVAKALRKHAGKNVDIGADLSRAAKAIGDVEAATADLAELLGADAPATAVMNAKALRKAMAAQVDASAANSARAAADIDTKVMPQAALKAQRNPFELEQQAAIEEQIRAGALREERGPFTPAGREAAAEREMARRGAAKTVVDKDIKAAMAGAKEDAKIAAANEKANAKIAQMATVAEKKPSVVHAVVPLVDDVASKIGMATESTAAPRKEDVTDKVKAAPAQTAARSAFGVAADIGTALEVLNAMGVHVPDVRDIPVIGPVLSLFLRARAVLGILGRKGGSIGRTAEGLVASKSATVRDRMSAAALAAFDAGAKGARAAAPLAGPAGALGHKLFPGDGETKSKDPRVLFEARSEEISRALVPGAIENAISDRIRSGDPELQQAIVDQVRRGLMFLDSKRPREAQIAGMIPGDGHWRPSRAALEEFSRYVAAVHDPAGVLEDVARGHVTIEGAETLKAVYPGLYAEAQRMLLEKAAEFQQTLKYSRRVAISIAYSVPVDLTMTAQHMQFLRQGAMPADGSQPQQPQPGAPALTAPLQLGQQTMTSLERRAGE